MVALRKEDPAVQSLRAQLESVRCERDELRRELGYRDESRSERERRNSVGAWLRVWQEGGRR